MIDPILEDTFNISLNMSREVALRTWDQKLQHAILITGAHVEDSETGEKRVKRFRVEDSWGQGPNEGLITGEWFRHFGTHVAVPRDLVEEATVKAYDSKVPIEIELWESW